MTTSPGLVAWAASSAPGRQSPPAGVHVAGASASSTTSPGSPRQRPPTGRAPPASSLDLLDLDAAAIPQTYAAPIRPRPHRTTDTSDYRPDRRRLGQCELEIVVAAVAQTEAAE